MSDRLQLPAVTSAGAARQETPPRAPAEPGANAQGAPEPARVHTREAGWWERLALANVAAVASGVFTGASAWTTQPPSLAQIWAHHVESARFYSGWVFRYPRYGFGVLQMPFAALAYLVVLATDSLWKIIGLALVVALVLWLL